MIILSAPPSQARQKEYGPDSVGVRKDLTPIARMHGKIFAADPAVLTITLAIKDMSSGKPIHFLSQPDRQKGEYVIYLPVNRTYELSICPAGYSAHIVQVFIPKNTYEYNFDRSLDGRWIYATNGETIGKELVVRSSKYQLVSVKDKQKSGVSPEMLYYRSLREITQMAFETGNALIMKELMETVYDYAEKESGIEAENRYGKLKTAMDSAFTTGDPAFIKKLHEEQELFKRVYSAESVPDIDKKGILSDSLRIFFAKNSSGTDLAQRDKVAEFALRFAKISKKKRAGKLILVEGFADSDGSAEVNQRISLRRAESVLRALRAENIENIVILKAAGADESSEPKAENRRVDVKVYDMH